MFLIKHQSLCKSKKIFIVITKKKQIESNNVDSCHIVISNEYHNKQRERVKEIVFNDLDVIFIYKFSLKFKKLEENYTRQKK